MKPVGLRWRLTLWYGAIFGAVLLMFSGALYLMMRHLPPADEPLLAELDELEQLVRNAPSLESVQSRCDRYFRRREGYRFQVRTQAGQVVFRSERLGDLDLPDPPASARNRAAIENHSLPGGQHLRIASHLVQRPDGPMVVQAALSLAPYDQQLWRLQILLLVTVPLALACGLGGGYLLAEKALSPMEEMVATASQITAQDLSRRIGVVRGGDELGRLADTLNGMIARLERSFEEVRRFTADAAHELRTPLAIMRSEAEVSLRSNRSPEEYRRVIESMLEETTHLSALAEQLLFLCREDAGLRTGSFQTTSLADLLEDLLDQIQVAAKDRNIALTAEVKDRCLTSGDPQQLRRLFMNLLDNAIKYTNPGGAVRVTCQRVADWNEIRVDDTGCGIPAEFLPFIFDRFYRVDSSRTQEVKGTGLGLAICRSIVEAHGGTIECASIVGTGTSFRVCLPPAIGVPSSRPVGKRLLAEPPATPSLAAR